MKPSTKAALTAAAVLSMSSPAMAQSVPQSASPEVRVGIVDVRADELTFADKRTSIEYRPFTEKGKWTAEWLTEAGVDHGQMMASAFVRQLRQVDPQAPVKIFAANVFQENSGTGSAKYTQATGTASRRTLSVNWEGAREALAWFKQNNVKVVLTAFNGNDSAAMRAFMKDAGDMGMTVFASAGNKVGGSIYPAAYPQAISVAGDNRDLAFRNDATLSRWVNFTMDGGVPMGASGRQVDEGSSFASAKAAALGAYYVAHHPDADRNQIASAIREAATPQSYQVQGVTVTALRFDERESSRRMVDIAREDMRVAVAAQPGPAVAPVVTAEAAPAPRAPAAAIAAAAGVGR